MSKEKDPLLKGKSISSEDPEVLPHEIPDDFISIPDDIFMVVASYQKLVWELNEDGKKVLDFNKIIKNTKFLFSEEGKYKDNLWKEHSALNLRELISCCDRPSDYMRAIKNIPETENDPTGFLGRVHIIEKFLNDVLHLRPEGAFDQSKKLFDEDFFENKESDERSIDEGIYEAVCIDLFYTLYEFYNKYAFNKDI